MTTTHRHPRSRSPNLHHHPHQGHPVDQRRAALLDLEASRNRAAERLVALQADYSAAAGRRAEELRGEVDAARTQFTEAMERLVAFAESLGPAEPSPA